MDLIAWIRDNLDRPGKSKAGLAAKLGLSHQSGVTRILNGTRKIQLHEMPLIEEYFGARLEHPENGDAAEMEAAIGIKNLIVGRYGVKLTASQEAALLREAQDLIRRNRPA